MRRRGLIGGMLVGGAAGAAVGHYSAKRQFESMSAAQAQQAQIDQATKAAQDAQAHARGAGCPGSEPGQKGYNQRS